MILYHTPWLQTSAPGRSWSRATVAASWGSSSRRFIHCPHLTSQNGWVWSSVAARFIVYRSIHSQFGFMKHLTTYANQLIRDFWIFLDESKTWEKRMVQYFWAGWVDVSKPPIVCNFIAFEPSPYRSWTGITVVFLGSLSMDPLIVPWFSLGFFDH